MHNRTKINVKTEQIVENMIAKIMEKKYTYTV